RLGAVLDPVMAGTSAPARAAGAAAAGATAAGALRRASRAAAARSGIELTVFLVVAQDHPAARRRHHEREPADERAGAAHGLPRRPSTAPWGPHERTATLGPVLLDCTRATTRSTTPVTTAAPPAPKAMVLPSSSDRAESAATFPSWLQT